MAKKFKLPSGKAMNAYLKRNTNLLLTGTGLGFVGAWYYLKELPREALAEVTTGRAGGVEAISNLSPEAKVFVVFIMTGLLMATIVAHFVGGKK